MSKTTKTRKRHSSCSETCKCCHSKHQESLCFKQTEHLKVHGLVLCLNQSVICTQLKCRLLLKLDFERQLEISCFQAHLNRIKTSVVLQIPSPTPCFFNPFSSYILLSLIQYTEHKVNITFKRFVRFCSATKPKTDSLFPLKRKASWEHVYKIN